jgi:hypothetical protein
MAEIWFLHWTPLISASIWIGLALYQVARDRFRTWTEVFLLATFFFVGAYALGHFFLFNWLDAGATAARLSFVCLGLAAVFFLLYGVVFHSRMRRRLLVLFLPTVAILFLVWARLIVSVIPDSSASAEGEIFFDQPSLAIWAAYMVAYSVGGILAFYRTYLEVRRQAPRIARRMHALLTAIIVTFVLGAGTDTLLWLVGTHNLPIFSTVLVVPGVLALIAVSPLGETGVMSAVRRWKSRTYQIKAVFLTYRDGTLIGAKVSPDEKTIDQDLLTGTLDVIQNFMQTSFPSLRDGFLRTIVHGEYRLVIERGRWVYATLVLLGEETDQLRRQIRDSLLTFEANNHRILDDWRGVPTEARGAEAVLGGFFSEDEVGT